MVLSASGWALEAATCCSVVLSQHQPYFWHQVANVLCQLCLRRVWGVLSLLAHPCLQHPNEPCNLLWPYTLGKHPGWTFKKLHKACGGSACLLEYS